MRVMSTLGVIVLTLLLGARASAVRIGPSFVVKTVRVCETYDPLNQSKSLLCLVSTEPIIRYDYSKPDKVERKS